MRVGLIGCGNVGVNVHLPALAAVEGVTVVAAADPTPARLELAGQAAGLPADRLYADWRDLLARADVDAVVVATPQKVRTEIALAAAAAGKHMLLEKPLALAPAAAQTIVAAARRAGVVVATNHNYRFMPVYAAIADLLAGGEIGSPELAVLNFMGVEDRPGAAAYAPRWRHTAAEAGGGVLMDMLHAVYLANWFLGADPVAVSAAVDRRFADGGDVEDWALVRLAYPSGHALINMAWGVGPGGVEITATNGRAVLVNQAFGTHPFVPFEKLVVVGPGGERTIVPAAAPAYGIAGVIADWRDAVRDGREPAASGAAGVSVLSAVVGAYASAALGREVALPLAAGDPVSEFGALGLGRLDLPAGSVVVRRGLYGVAARADAAIGGGR